MNEEDLNELLKTRAELIETVVGLRNAFENEGFDRWMANLLAMRITLDGAKKEKGREPVKGMRQLMDEVPHDELDPCFLCGGVYQHRIYCSARARLILGRVRSELTRLNEGRNPVAPAAIDEVIGMIDSRRKK